MPNCNYYRDYLMMHTVGGFLRVLRVVHIEDLTPTPVTTFIFSVIVVYTSSVIFVNVTNTCIHIVVQEYHNKKNRMNCNNGFL